MILKRDGRTGVGKETNEMKMRERGDAAAQVTWDNFQFANIRISVCKAENCFDF